MRYLVLKANRYWFKRDIPAKIRGQFDGLTAVVRNLDTSDLKVAKKRRDEIAGHIERQFQAARAGEPLPAQELIRQQAERWAKEREDYIADPTGWTARTGLDNPYDLITQEADRLGREHGPAAEEQFDVIVIGRQAIDYYIDTHLSEEDITAKAKAERRSAVSEFASWARREDLSLPRITRRAAGRYVSEVLAPLHRKTGAKRLSNIRCYWNWLVERGHFEQDNPWVGQKLSAPKRNRDDDERAFTEEEFVKLFTTHPTKAMRDTQRLYDAMKVAALSGMRIEEICRLTVADCTDGVFVVRRGKTVNAERSVPIHPELGALVARRCEGKKRDERLFSDVAGKGTSLSDPLSKQFGRFIRDIGLADVREGQRRSKTNFHSFRRWFATQAERAGQPPHIISSVLGHAEGRKGMTLGKYSEGPAAQQFRACVEAVKLPETLVARADSTGSRPMAENTI